MPYVRDVITVFLLSRLTYFTQHGNSRSIHVAANDIISFFLMAE